MTASGARRRPGRPRSAEADRAILGATLQLALESGLSRMTMEAVAARAGVGKATVYRRWDSKEALFVDALRSVAADLEPPDTGSFRGDWLAIFGGEEAAITPAAVRLVPRLLAESADDPALYRAIIDTFVAPRRAIGVEAVRRAIARGELRKDVDPELVVDLVVGPLVYRALIADPDLRSLRRHAEQVIDELLTGLSAARPGATAAAGRRRRAG
jgi:AcrR family transcriptional regulator